MGLPDGVVKVATGLVIESTGMASPSTSSRGNVTRDSALGISSTDDRFRFCDSLGFGVAEARFLLIATFGSVLELAGVKIIGEL